MNAEERREGKETSIQQSLAKTQVFKEDKQTASLSSTSFQEGKGKRFLGSTGTAFSRKKGSKMHAASWRGKVRQCLAGEDNFSRRKT